MPASMRSISLRFALLEWLIKMKVKLTREEALTISAMLDWFRKSESGQYFIFGPDSIKRMENVIDAQLWKN